MSTTTKQSHGHESRGKDPMTLAPLVDIYRDDRDLVIADLADAEAALLERVAALETEHRVYRDIAIVAIHGLHGLYKQLRLARDTAAMIRNERRPTRAKELAA